MKIKKAKNIIVFEGKNVNVVIAGNDSIAKDIEKYKPDIILTGQKLSKKQAGAVVVDRAGEFEIKDVLINALGEDKGKIKLFSFDIDGIKVVYFDKNIKGLSKTEIDRIGISHILLSEDWQELDRTLKLLEKVEPEIFIPLTNEEEKVAKLANQLSISLPDRENFLKYQLKDFGDERAVMTINILKHG